MTTQEQISLASAVIAVISVMTNIVQAVIIRRLDRGKATRDAIVAAARPLLQTLIETRLFEVDPNEEIWEFGLPTVKNLASQSALFQAVMRSKFVNDDTRQAVTRLSENVRQIRALEDSWKIYRVGKEGDWREIQRTWPNIERANALLKAAQPGAAHCKRSLEKFLESA